MIIFAKLMFNNNTMEIENLNHDEVRIILLKILEAINSLPHSTPKQNADQDESNRAKLVYGIKGLAILLNISIPKAQSLKNSGILDLALYQIGRKVAFDGDKVLSLLKVIPDNEQLELNKPND